MATYNVGARKPDEYGHLFAWGETAQKDYYTWDDYKYGCYVRGYVKKLTYKGDSLKLVDDAAAVNWGGGWRTPTCEEFRELKDSCKWEWTIFKSRKGCKVTGPNGNSIFLTAAGIRDDEEYNQRYALCYQNTDYVPPTWKLELGKKGFYWSSSGDSLLIHLDNDDDEVQESFWARR